MSSLITVDAKGNVYLVPENVLKKYCKKVGTISDKKRKGKMQVQGQDDWFVCQAWLNCGSSPK
jgi:hypothetical protein